MLRHVSVFCCPLSLSMFIHLFTILLLKYFSFPTQNTILYIEQLPFTRQRERSYKMAGKSRDGLSKRPRMDNLAEEDDIMNRVRELEEENKRMKEVESENEELREAMEELRGMVECPVCLLLPKPPQQLRSESLFLHEQKRASLCGRWLSDGLEPCFLP